MGILTARDAEVWSRIFAKIAACSAADTLEIFVILCVYCSAGWARRIALRCPSILQIIGSVTGQTCISLVDARGAWSLALLADAIDIRVTERTLRYAPVAHQHRQGTGSIAIGAISFGSKALGAWCLTIAASLVYFRLGKLSRCQICQACFGGTVALNCGGSTRHLLPRRYKEACITSSQASWLSNELVWVVLAA